MEPLSSTRAYRDAFNFDALNDQRAEDTIGTGEPLTLARYARNRFPTIYRPVTHQAPAAAVCPLDEHKGTLLPHDGGRTGATTQE